MGLLTADDDAIKKSLLYQKASKAQASIDEALAAFKKKGGTGGVLPDLARACKQAMVDIDKAAKQYPDFKEFGEMRTKAMEVVNEIVKAFPDHPAVASTDLKKAAGDPAFRFW